MDLVNTRLLPRLILLAEVSERAIETNANILRHATQKDRDAMVKIEKLIAEQTSENSKALDEIEKSIVSEAAKKLFDKLEEARKAYAAVRQKALDTSNTATSRDAIVIFESELLPVFATYENAINSCGCDCRRCSWTCADAHHLEKAWQGC